MKTIAAHIQDLDDLTIARTRRYLDSNKVKSVKLMHVEDEPNEFEVFIYENGQVLMPCIEVDNELQCLNLHCQCEEDDDALCVHKIALLLAAQFMITANYPDYHMACKLQTAQALGARLFPNNPIQPVS